MGPAFPDRTQIWLLLRSAQSLMSEMSAFLPACAPLATCQSCTASIPNTDWRFCAKRSFYIAQVLERGPFWRSRRSSLSESATQIVYLSTWLAIWDTMSAIFMWKLLMHAGIENERWHCTICPSIASDTEQTTAWYPSALVSEYETMGFCELAK